MHLTCNIRLDSANTGFESICMYPVACLVCRGRERSVSSEYMKYLFTDVYRTTTNQFDCVDTNADASVKQNIVRKFVIYGYNFFKFFIFG